MDLTFAVQALCAYHLAREQAPMENKVHLLAKAMDDEEARLKLEAVGMGVDALTPEQEEFLAGSTIPRHPPEGPMQSRGDGRVFGWRGLELTGSP